MGELRRILAIAAAGVALTGGAAHAQSHRYLLLSDADPALIVDVAGAVRNGAVVQMDGHILRRAPVMVAGLEVHWFDGIEEVDCAGHRSRFLIMSELSLDRTQKHGDLSVRVPPWIAAQPGSSGAKLEGFFCQGASDPGLPPVASLAEFQRAFMGAAAPAASSARPTPSRYYVVLSDSEKAELVDMASRTSSGGMVRLTELVLLTRPLPAESTPYYWLQLRSEFDCAHHAWREAIEKAYTLDMKQEGPAPSLKFIPWTPITNDSVAAEAEQVICLGKLSDEDIPVSDLSEFQRQFFAFTKTPEPSAPPAH